ncbi:MBL fold metallo-hydrolase [Cutibacterium equinum]|uniref:MBL fold metallo-hydrolase n=1 Tax=Cutibacterium equinum TaxID=3016342 RepID=A0ABY7R0A2_9ACTN|nr:MBL fold metallo-hydrolase [Cutibacterium equinum]WCC80671.1 MBL fold metallo-hydrolase [Cutibacterium equinum]
MSTNPQNPEWTALTARVWTTTIEPETVTCGLVAGDDHVLLIDTGSSPEQGARLAMSAAAMLGRPVDRVVVTHHHDDHSGGLAGIDGAQSWMHEAAVAHCPGLRVDHPIALMAYVDLGGLGAEVIHPGPGHTDGDLVVIIREEKVTFVGDLVETAGPPQSDETTDVRGWPRAIDAVITGTDGVGVYVPGHGRPVDAVAVMEQRGDLAERIPVEIPLTPVGQHIPPQLA